MNVKVNETEYHGFTAFIMALFLLPAIGVIFLAIGVALTSPVWLLALFLMRG